MLNSFRQVCLGLEMVLATLQESLTVTAEAPLVETTQKSIETNVSPEEVDSLPLKTRNFTDLALLAPGVGVDTTSANSNTDPAAVRAQHDRHDQLTTMTSRYVNRHRSATASAVAINRFVLDTSSPFG